LQVEFEPPGVAALADAGAPCGRLKAALHGRVSHIGNRQLAADVLQQLNSIIQ
jgi:hypothetical protein